MKTKIFFIALTALALMIGPAQVFAQDAEEEEGNYFSVSTYNWSFDTLDELIELMEEDNDVIAQNEFILSRKVFRHAWAGEYSVMIILEYASFGDVTKAQDRGAELYEAKYPDEEARDARDDKFLALQGHGMHNDDIVQGIPSLTK